MIPDRENLVLTLRIISDSALASSSEDDETLIKRNLGNIITKKCIICPGDVVERFVAKHGLNNFYLRLRILECDMHPISRYVTLSGKDDMMKVTNIHGSKKIEIIAKPIPPGIVKRKELDIDSSITRLGEHFLHKPSALGWVKRYLALGRICSYPFSFSKLDETEERKTPILYFFDQEELFEPVSAFRLDHIEDACVESRIADVEYNFSDVQAQSNDNIFYHWSLKLHNSKQPEPTKLNLKGTRLDHINKTISAILMMRQKPNIKADRPSITKERHRVTRPNTSSVQIAIHLPPILEALHWYIEEIISIMTCDENAQYVSTKGIFRISGRLNMIEQIYDKILNPTTIPGDPDILSLLNQLEVHDLAGLLKKLVREYPGRLIPRKISEWLLSPSTTDNALNPDRIMSIFSLSLQKDKIHDFKCTEEDYYRLELLIKLMRFLKRVSEHSEDKNGKDSDDGGNMMNAHNLAIIFSPNLFDLQDQPVVLSKKSNNRTNQIHSKLKYMTCMIQFLIENVADLCE